MSIVWKANEDIHQLVHTVAEKNHFPRMENASIAVAFNDSKAFLKNKFNWGGISKFSSFNKIWQVEKFDFCLSICSDVWQDLLNSEQREALIDLHLTRCEVEYVAETVMEGKKKIVVKDDWGRVQYTNEIKLDDDGNPKWNIAPLDISCFVQNVSRYGLWCTKFCEIQSLIPSKDQDEE